MPRPQIDADIAIAEGLKDDMHPSLAEQNHDHENRFMRGLSARYTRDNPNFTQDEESLRIADGWDLENDTDPEVDTPQEGADGGPAPWEEYDYLIFDVNKEDIVIYAEWPIKWLKTHRSRQSSILM